jgi:hypothetical protein
MPQDLLSWPALRRRLFPFVLLRHTGSRLGEHYDLMLETRDGTEMEESSLWALSSHSCPRLQDHRLEWRTHGFHRRRYLFFEGPLSNNRGQLRRIDAGVYSVRGHGGRLRISLNGLSIRGDYDLFRRQGGRHVWIQRRN